MAKGTWGIVAILLYSSLAMAAGVVPDEEAAPQDALTGPQDGVMLQGISDEERERRVQVCERGWEACMDWCKSSKGGHVCEEGCSRKLSDCMKNIPYAKK